MATGANAIATEREAATKLYYTGTDITDNKCVTKSKVISMGYYQATPLGGYADNQLVKYTDIQPQLTSSAFDNAYINVYCALNLSSSIINSYPKSSIYVTIDGIFTFNGTNYTTSATFNWDYSPSASWTAGISTTQGSVILQFSNKGTASWPIKGTAPTGTLIVSATIWSNYAGSSSCTAGSSNNNKIIIATMDGYTNSSSAFSGITSSFSFHDPNSQSRSHTVNSSNDSVNYNLIVVN